MHYWLDTLLFDKYLLQRNSFVTLEDRLVYGNRYALFILRISLLSFFLFFGLKIFHAKYYIQMNYCLYFNSWTGSHSNSSGSWNVQMSEAQLNTFMFRLQRGTVFNKLFACHITMLRKSFVSSFQNGEYYLKKDGPHADSVEMLMYEYYTTELPTAKACLETPFKLHPKYKG